MATKLELIVFARTHGIHYSGLSKAQLSDRISQAGYDPENLTQSEGNEMSDQTEDRDEAQTPPGPDPSYAATPATTEEGEGVEQVQFSQGIRGPMFHGPFPPNANFDPSSHHNIPLDEDLLPEQENLAEWHGEAHAAWETQRDELGPQGMETPAQTQEREQAAHEEAVEAKRERSESTTEQRTESTTTERAVS